MHNTFTKRLLSWHKKNIRNLPWKEDKDAYKIWVSEIILQQTRVAQGIPYYLKFISTFPSIEHLANSDEEKLLKIWQGLGYYNRARNMHQTAKYISKELDGKFPDNYDGLLALKGIGPYTAAAIASFAFDKPHPVVDGNVLRVITRFKGIKSSIDTSQGKKEVQEFCSNAIEAAKPAVFNQAIMDFGATQCKPSGPSCGICPMTKSCFAFINDCVSEIPMRTKKVSNRIRVFQYFVIEDGDNILVQKRTSKDIWQGLYQFPMIERKTTPTIKMIQKLLELEVEIKAIKKETLSVKSLSQKLSHQTIHGVFTKYRAKMLKMKEESTFELIPKKSLKEKAVPRMIDLYLKDNSITLF